MVWEPINVAAIKEVCRYEAARRATFEVGGGKEVSLSCILHSFIVREKASSRPGFIPVLWSEHKRFASLGFGNCRRYSGIHACDELDLSEDVLKSVSDAVEAGLTTYEATVSAFAYGKIIKYIVREGHKIADCDIQACFVRMFLLRHQCALLQDFLDSRKTYYAKAGGEEFADEAKTLYLSCLFGSHDGGDADAEWTAATNLPAPKHVKDTSFMVQTQFIPFLSI